MFFPLSQLPLELLDIIVGLLGTQDIVNLVQCMPYLVSKQAYHTAFHDPRQFAHYDLKLFQKRARARFYVNGLPLKSGIVVEPGLHYGSALYLSSKGSVIWDGQNETVETDKLDDYDQNRSNSQIGLTEPLTEIWNSMGNPPWLRSDCPIGPVDDQFVKDSDKLVERKSVRFSRLCANSDLCLYDEDDWVWIDIEKLKTLEHGLPWAPIAFVDSETGTRISKGMVDVVADHHTVILLVRGRGVFASDSEVFRAEYPNRYRSDIRCFDDHVCRVEVSLVPGTEGAQQISGFGSMIICLRPNGTISGFKHSQDDYHDEDHKLGLVPKLNKYGPFVLLKATTGQLILVTRNGLVITTQNGSVRVIDDFLVLQICSVAISVACYFVLTNDGSVYSWGFEIPLVNSLGLSNLTRDKSGCSRVDRPTKIELPGEAYALCVHETLLGFLVGE